MTLTRAQKTSLDKIPCLIVSILDYVRNNIIIKFDSNFLPLKTMYEFPLLPRPDALLASVMNSSSFAVFNKDNKSFIDYFMYMYIHRQCAQYNNNRIVLQTYYINIDQHNPRKDNNLIIIIKQTLNYTDCLIVFTSHS